MGRHHVGVNVAGHVDQQRRTVGLRDEAGGGHDLHHPHHLRHEEGRHPGGRHRLRGSHGSPARGQRQRGGDLRRPGSDGEALGLALLQVQPGRSQEVDPGVARGRRRLLLLLRPLLRLLLLMRLPGPVEQRAHDVLLCVGGHVGVEGRRREPLAADGARTGRRGRRQGSHDHKARVSCKLSKPKVTLY